MPGNFAFGFKVFLNLLLLQTPASSGSPLGMLGGMLPILLIFAIFYFLLFMPMQRQRKQQAKMMAGLQNGDVVVTSGGIVGAIVAIENDTLVLRVKPDNVKIQVTRSSVSGLVVADGKIPEGKK
jgi:preprotein translocase subunit YajC